MSDDSKLGAVVPRDRERFARPFPEGRPAMPPGYSAPLDMRPIRVLIGESARARALGGAAS